MQIRLYNTLSRTEEPFEPGDPDRVTMYVCGPTVYNHPHIGNARPEVVFDVLARLLRTRYRLVYARNFTDVDDKINKAAAEEGVDIAVLTGRYVEAYRESMAALGVQPPDLEPRVTEHMPEIVAMIERLIASGHAYEAEGHVLFDVPSYGAYGQLSRRSQEDMLAGARVEVAPYKRNASDFVLWKPSDAHVVGWPSPWGRGRPGWHIECSTMIAAHLGETIDIHGGGQDLVFPHHENEIAQSTCAHDGVLFCRYWLHNGMVDMGSEKMSKSLGNVRLVRDLVAQAPGEAVRLALLTAHYRQPLEWTIQVIEEARQKLDRLYGTLRDAGVSGRQDERPHEEAPEAVLAALSDDLNTPQALAELFGLARSANRSQSAAERRALAGKLRAGAWLLGLLQQDPAEWFASGRAPAGRDAVDETEIEALVARREALRRQKNFAAADKIRAELAQRGIVIEDVTGGTRWRRE